MSELLVQVHRTDGLISRQYIFDSDLKTDNGDLYLSNGEHAHVYKDGEYQGGANNIFDLCKGLKDLV